MWPQLSAETFDPNWFIQQQSNWTPATLMTTWLDTSHHDASTSKPMPNTCAPTKRSPTVLEAVSLLSSLSGRVETAILVIPTANPCLDLVPPFDDPDAPYAYGLPTMQST